jgi:hypothetical protein
VNAVAEIDGVPRRIDGRHTPRSLVVDLSFEKIKWTEIYVRLRGEVWRIRHGNREATNRVLCVKV